MLVIFAERHSHVRGQNYIFYLFFLLPEDRNKTGRFNRYAAHLTESASGTDIVPFAVDLSSADDCLAWH